MSDIDIQDPEYGQGPPRVVAVQQTWWDKHQAKIKTAGALAGIIAALATVLLLLVMVLRLYNNIRNHYDGQIDDQRKELSQEIKALDSRLRVTENDVTWAEGYIVARTTS